MTERTHALGRLEDKGERENNKGLKGMIRGRQQRNQPRTSFAMPILSSRCHASALPYIWYQVSRFGSANRLRTPECLQRMYMALTISATCGIYY